MGGVLAVAAGEGGDAIAASALAGVLPLLDPVVVMTYSWDRLMIDPVPGPRSAADFTGLRRLAPGVLEVVPSTTAIAPARSSLPRLSAELPARLLLLDPAGAAVGAAAQIRSAAQFFGADEIALVESAEMYSRPGPTLGCAVRSPTSWPSPHVPLRVCVHGC